ncbi:MAG: Gfo/Idh/MocA family oxidoreductase [Candidatus Omnitrophica bacterium]|nr:Gfo/Idh/MocA family oxidoreductase [Candidatus Omnitrophota bacterium]
MKALVVGAGRMGSAFDEIRQKTWINTHTGAYVKNARINCIAVCDKDKSALERAVDHWGLKHSYTDIEKALDEYRPQVVSLCVGPHLVLGMLKKIAACDSVRFVWLEKPFSNSLRNAKKQIDILKRKRIRFVTNYQRRFDPFYIYIKKNMKALVGEPLKCSCFFSGGIVNTASHLVNTLIFFFGKPKQCKRLDIKKDKSGSFHGDFELKFKGFSAFCFEIGHQASVLSGAYSIFEMQIFGTKGRLDIKGLPFNEYEIRYYQSSASRRFKNVKVLAEKRLALSFKRDYMERALKALLARTQPSDAEGAVDTLNIFQELGLIK